MQIGVDQRRERHRAFHGRIDFDAQLAQEIELRPKAGRHDQFIDDNLPCRVVRADDEARAIDPDMGDAELAFDPDLAFGNKASERGAQCTARDQLVVGAAAKRLGGIVAAQQPQRPRVRFLLGELSKVDQGADGRMSRAEYGNRPAGISRPIPAEHVGML